MISALAAVLVAVISQEPVERAGLIGLVTLPEVFGGEPCVPFEPRAVQLFPAPGAREPVAEIHVDTPWTSHAQGGCDGLEVRVHRKGHAASPVPTQEFGYEMPAAIVVGRKGDWLQVRTAGGPLWLRLTGDRKFLPLVDLLSGDPLAYLTSDWDGVLYETPGGRRVSGVMLPPDTHVRVLATTRSAGGLWLHVQTEPGCDGSDKPEPASERGWVHAIGIRGAPSVWFHSRGC